MNDNSNISTIVSDVIDALNSLKDPKRIAFAARTFPTHMKVIGVVNPNMKLIAKELKKSTKEFTPHLKLGIVKSLISTGIFECQFVAFEFLSKDKKILKIVESEDRLWLETNMDNWVSVDTYSCYILGYLWRNNKVTDSEILSYLASDDFWKRRTAVVASVALNLKSSGGNGDLERTLMICAKVVSDHHDMIVKALSWSLRELSKRFPEDVSNFLSLHKHQLHKKVIREVNRKLDTGKKN